MKSSEPFLDFFEVVVSSFRVWRKLLYGMVHARCTVSEQHTVETTSSA